tara:strand:+ start:164623 stop:164907 length:285 start_codon:yes stop_codon:yes gene_type:complete
VAPALGAYAVNDLCGTVRTDAALSLRDRAPVTFAALVTRHEADSVGRHAALALDAGVTPAELSETIPHLAFDACWPRVFSAMPVARQVFESRAN